jgi:hypothetical protein
LGDKNTIKIFKSINLKMSTSNPLEEKSAFSDKADKGFYSLLAWATFLWNKLHIS